MQASIRHVGNDLICHTPGGVVEEWRIDGKLFLPRLRDWAARYDRAVQRDHDDALMELGRDLFKGLDEGRGWASAWANEAGARVLEIAVTYHDDPLANALLDAPWELLAQADGFLADDEVQRFELTRRMGAAQPAPLAKHADLKLMFMVAAPKGEHELDYEAEEAAILNATKRLPLHLVVEESGAAQPLADRLAMDGPFEALHLSCHGGIDPHSAPYLAFEQEAGGLHAAYAGDLAQLLGTTDHTPLVFLSACQTAEQQTAAPAGGAARASEPFVRQLIRAGVHNVLGWDGSVYDSDAAGFAQAFYRELTLYKSIPHAAAMARQTLRQSNRSDRAKGRHWHLARLYLGTHGGGALVGAGLPKRKLASTSHSNQFLDAKREVPVASRKAFVGRRRPLQTSLRALGAGDADQAGRGGVLLHGMGNLGKSSLAHRVATRLTNLKTVVVAKRYDALAIFDCLLELAPPQQRQAIQSNWRDAVAAHESALADALEAMLESAFADQPILLVIDDLEQMLEVPGHSVTAATPVQARFRPALAAVLGTFAKVRTDSRLLLTSRYTFCLTDASGIDLAQGLTHVPLHPMAERDRIKQLRALASPEQLAHIDEALAQRVLTAARGNPGLQTTLMTPLLAGEAEAARQAVQVIEQHQQTGVAPQALADLLAQGVAADQGNALLAYFKRMAFEVYRAALTPEQARLLAVACLFDPGLPIPRTALEAGAAALGLAMPSAALNRLLALCLLDDWGSEAAIHSVSVNPLARPLAAPLSADETKTVANDAVTLVADAWRRADGEMPVDVRGVQLARLALLAPQCPAAVLDAAATAAARFVFNEQHNAPKALAVFLAPSLARLSALATAPSADLALVTFDCAERAGDVAMKRLAIQVLSPFLDQAIGDDDWQAGSALLRLAGAHLTAGEMAQAEHCFVRAAAHFKNAGAERDAVIALGGLADILQARGQLDEALRIRTDEMLPVFERLGDVRSKAVTLGQIADILQARGQLDEALRIRTDEQLPVYERLGDVREKAVTLGKIADMLQARGQLDEALRIRTDEELPVYERLGDVRSKAVTLGQIADILQARGQLDEALRIRTEEQLPVYERLGDVDGVANVRYSIASIQLARGEHERGGIQAIYENLAQAYAINLKLQRADGMGAVGTLFAQVLAMGGQPKQALAVLDQAEAAFAKLGNAQGVAQAQQLRSQIQGAA